MQKLFGFMVLTLAFMICLGTVGCRKTDTSVKSSASGTVTKVEKTEASGDSTTVETKTTKVEKTDTTPTTKTESKVDVIPGTSKAPPKVDPKATEKKKND